MSIDDFCPIRGLINALTWPERTFEKKNNQNDNSQTKTIIIKSAPKPSSVFSDENVVFDENISYFSYCNIMFKKDSDGMERKTNDLLHHHYYWIPAAKNRLFLISSKFIFYYLAVDPYDLWSLWSCGSHLIILNYTAAFLLHAEHHYQGL